MIVCALKGYWLDSRTCNKQTHTHTHTHTHARCPTPTYPPTTTSTISFHACTSHHGGPAGVPPSVAHVASVACPAVRTHGLAGPGMAPAPPSTRSRTAPAPGLVAWCDGHAGGACGV